MLAAWSYQTTAAAGPATAPAAPAAAAKKKEADIVFFYEFRRDVEHFLLPYFGTFLARN